jgi:hypothetical protein
MLHLSTAVAVRFLCNSWGPEGWQSANCGGAMDSLPHTWYPFARTKKKWVVMHVGPTNSGKTYMALESLRLSASGLSSSIWVLNVDNDKTGYFSMCLFLDI